MAVWILSKVVSRPVIAVVWPACRVCIWASALAVSVWAACIESRIADHPLFLLLLSHSCIVYDFLVHSLLILGELIPHDLAINSVPCPLFVQSFHVFCEQFLG